MRPPPLYYTSLIFLIPSIYGQGTTIGKLFTIVTALSVLNHGKKNETYLGKSVVLGADRLVAHIAAVVMVRDSMILICHFRTMWYAITFQLCFVYCTLNYYVIQKNAKSIDIANWWHVTLHFASLIGTMAILHSKNFL
jgi:hypothetical protein